MSQHPATTLPAEPSATVGTLPAHRGHRIVTSGSQLLRSTRFWYAVAPWLYVGAMLVYGRAWLGEGLPQGDLAGAAAELARWQQIVAEGRWLGVWEPSSFLGQPRALMNLYSGMALCYAPFLLLFDALEAVKVGSVVYLGLAGFTAFILVHRLVRHLGIALVLGMAYAVHPIHLSVAAATSHANFPPYYAIQPLLVLAVLGVLGRPSAIRIVCCAVAGAAALWIDLERVAVLVPGLAILAGAVWAMALGRRRRMAEPLDAGAVVAPLAGLAVAAVLAGGLLAGLLLPAVVDKPLHALFSEDVLTSSVAFFSVQNPLYYIDRDGAWFANAYAHLPPAHAHDAGSFYWGWGLLALVAAGVLVPVRGGMRRGVQAGVLLGGAVTVAAAHGQSSGYRALVDIFHELFLHAPAREAAAGELVRLAALILIALGLFIGGASFAARRGWTVPRGVWVLLAAVLIVLLARPYTWLLAHVPPYDTMRNPAWFASAMPPLALVVAAGLGWRGVLDRFARPRRSRSTGPFGPDRLATAQRTLCVLLPALLLAADAWTYRASFSNLRDAEAVTELRTIGRQLQADPRSGRVLPRESYNPHADLLYSFSGRPTAFSWLNWMAPKGTSELVLERIYAKLHRPETIEAALELAGQAHVRYVLYDLAEGPPPPATDALAEVWSGEQFALYENLLCRPMAYLHAEHGRANPASPEESAAGSANPADRGPGTAGADPVRVQGGQAADKRVLEVETEARGLLVLAESWAPHWRARRNGEPVAIRPVQGALMGVKVPAGRSRIVFHYDRQRPQAAGLMVSGMAAVGCLFLVGRWWWQRRTARLPQPGTM